MTEFYGHPTRGTSFACKECHKAYIVNRQHRLREKKKAEWELRNPGVPFPERKRREEKQVEVVRKAEFRKEKYE